jgi:hypothetical protein
MSPNIKSSNAGSEQPRSFTAKGAYSLHYVRISRPIMFDASSSRLETSFAISC